jgi:hypothetical protein
MVAVSQNAFLDVYFGNGERFFFTWKFIVNGEKTLRMDMETEILIWTWEIEMTVIF